MNWDAIGAVGEIIGALAVFLTLAYLAMQIRQNTRAVQSSAIDSSIGGISATRQALFENAELATLYLKGSEDPESLNETESLQYRMLVHNMLLSQANIFSQTKYTDLPTSTWESQKPIILRVIESTGGKWFWERYQEEFESEFRNEVNRMVRT